MKLSILSLNAHKFFSPFRVEYTLASLKNLLDRLDTDVVLIQELQGTIPPRYSPDFDKNPLEHLADQVWPYFAYGKNAIYSGGHHGNAILSKYPIETWDNTDISNHRFESRGLLHGKVLLPNMKYLHIACTHLDLTEIGRRKQYQKIIRGLSPLIKDHEPVVLGGDLNDWRGTSESFFKDYGFTQTSDKATATFPSFFPFLTLDKVFLKNIKCLLIKTLDLKIWKKISDHLPIYLEVEIPDEDDLPYL